MKVLTKIQIICYFLLISLASYISAQTEVSGIIPFNTTWRVDLSPYSVVGNVQVPDGVTLTIEPGVEIQYAGAYEILVQGNIIANGTIDDSITFIFSASDTLTGATMLRFVETDLANSELSYIKMEWATKAIFTDAGNTDTLSVYHLKLFHSTINQGTSSYTSPRGTGSIYLSDAVISNATIEIGNSFLEIENSDITDATINLNYASSNAALLIEGCALTNTVVFSDRDAWSQYMKITGSALTNSEIKCGSIDCEVSECTLVNSPIEGFTGGILTILNTTINYSGDYGVNCNTGDYSKNCIIQSSQITGSGTGIAVNINNGSVLNSEISNNDIAIKIGTNQHVASAPGDSVLNCEFTGNTTYNVENRTDNSIIATDNWWGTIDVAEIKTKIWDYHDDINYGEVVFSPLLMTEEGPSNYVPVVDVFADPLLGRVPSTVTFTASATDPDGTIELYEWDFDGDGTYDWSSTVNGNTEHTYGTSGEYIATCRITDNLGLSNRTTINIKVLALDELAEVSGTIPFSTTWRVDLSPYSVVGNVQVPDGVTLTIEPGVEIQYAGAYEILVQGNIIANGTIDDSITFIFSASDTLTGATMLRFVETDLANSELSYIKMEWATKAIFTDAGNTDTLSVYHLKLFHSTINQGTSSYTSPRGTGSIYLSDAVISNATIEIGNSFLEIENSDITDATINLNYASSNAALLIEGCALTNTVVFSDRDAWSQYMKITGSALTNSEIKCGSIDCEVSECTLVNSPIEGFTGGILTILNTTINYSGDYGVNCNTGDYSKNCIIQSSQITGSGTGIAVNINNGSVLNSEISNNDIAIKIGTNQHVASAPGDSVLNCEFTGNTTYNVENRTDNSIIATDNWWGTIDVAEIKTKIWDYHDDINYGEVVFSPLLMTEEGPSNYVPVVDVFADPLLGRVPSTVTFTASATDPDGTIELYEWDFNGDGTYDWNSTVNGNTTFEYVESCRNAIELKVLDDQGLANVLNYNINIIDFHTDAEVMGATVAVEWDWGNYQTVLIPYGALTFLDNGDEIHIIDKDGIITETCPIEEDDYGEISVANNEYSDTYDSIYVFRCMESINDCEYNGTVQKGYTPADTMIFRIYDTSEDSYYEIFPETIENGSIIFGDTVITLITSFNTMHTENIFSKKTYNTHGTENFSIIANTTEDNFKFNIYKNSVLLEEAFSQKYYFDSDIEEYSTYSYEIYIVNADGEEVLSRSKTITTGLLTDLFNITDQIDTYHLFQNYPNPFNPVTTINFQIPEASFVTLSIYDLNGRLIETLINEHKKTGHYTVKWNAAHLVSGIYIYRISAGDFSNVKKCLIIK